MGSLLGFQRGKGWEGQIDSEQSCGADFITAVALRDVPSVCWFNVRPRLVDCMLLLELVKRRLPLVIPKMMHSTPFCLQGCPATHACTHADPWSRALVHSHYAGRFDPGMHCVSTGQGRSPTLPAWASMWPRPLPSGSYCAPTSQRWAVLPLAPCGHLACICLTLLFAYLEASLVMQVTTFTSQCGACHGSSHVRTALLSVLTCMITCSEGVRCLLVLS